MGGGGGGGKDSYLCHRQSSLRSKGFVRFLLFDHADIGTRAKDGGAVFSLSSQFPRVQTAKIAQNSTERLVRRL